MIDWISIYLLCVFFPTVTFHFILEYLLILFKHLLTLVTGIHAALCTSCPGCL